NTFAARSEPSGSSSTSSSRCSGAMVTRCCASRWSTSGPKASTSSSSSAPSWASSSGSWRAGPRRHGGERGCDEAASGRPLICRLTVGGPGAMLETAMGQALTVLELSDRCGEPVERLRAWRAAGLLGTEETDLYAPEDLQRIRMIQFLLRRGFELDAIARANRDAGLVTTYVDLLSP